MYLFRCGFLDRGAGFVYCRLVAFYEYLIVLNLREIQRRRGDRHRDQYQDRGCPGRRIAVGRRDSLT